VAQALATLKFLHSPGGVFEICLIGPKSPTSAQWTGRAFGKKPIVAGWFKDPAKAAELAATVQAEGIYTTLNPCVDALLGRANERLLANVARTQDKEISHIRNLLIDLDPIRPAGISSSGPEHEAALNLAEEIRADLEKAGWPEPLVGDSGNGAHLVYPLEMENTPENAALLQAVLQALAGRYGPRFRDLDLELDQTVFNPARLSKVYGTVAGKGENLPGRPHRRAQILSLPAERVPVARELLEKLVESFPAPQPSPARREGGKSGGSGVKAANSGQKEGVFDLGEYLRHYASEVVKIKEHGGGVLHCLQECLFDPGHSGNEAAIGQTAEGKLFYQCFHNSCKGRTWAEARQIISGNDKLTRFMPAPPKRERKKKAAAGGGAPPGEQEPPATEEFSWSELGNARRLVAQQGRDLRYNHLAKKWLYWTGKNWRVDDSGEIARRAKAVIDGIYQEAMDADTLERRQKLFKWALQSEKASQIRGMLCLAQSEPGIPVLPEEMDVNPWLFNCANGTINLKTGELQPHRREDLLTCLSPIAYDPQATCKKWEAFLFDVFEENQSLVDFIWSSLGYALTGDCREQCFWIFWGFGANGKGTLMNCVQEIMGTYAMHISTETLMARTSPGEIRNDVAQLNGPRFITASEIDKGRRLGESLVKELTGQDPIRARFLYGENFQFVPQFKLFLATNNKPAIRDQTNAIWRRLKLVKFSRDYKDNPDGELPHKLMAEAKGILAWLVRGCLDWQRHGDLNEPDEVKEATAEYRAEMDRLREFLEACCVIGPGFSVSAGDLYVAYDTWAKDSGLDKRERLFKTAFGSALEEKGFKAFKGTGGVRMRLGLALRSVD
jgi:putative DNA primase/helicase